MVAAVSISVLFWLGCNSLKLLVKFIVIPYDSQVYLLVVNCPKIIILLLVVTSKLTTRSLLLLIELIVFLYW